MKKYVIYTSNNCMQCTFTKKYMADKAIPYEEINLDDQPEYREVLKAEGLRTNPVLKDEDGNTITTGFRPEILNTLAE